MGLHERGEDGQEKGDVVHRATERREQVEVCQLCSVNKELLLLQPALQLYVTKLARAAGGGVVME